MPAEGARDAAGGATTRVLTSRKQGESKGSGAADSCWFGFGNCIRISGDRRQAGRQAEARRLIFVGDFFLLAANVCLGI